MRPLSSESMVFSINELSSISDKQGSKPTLFEDRLYKFVEHNKLLNESQYGFRKGRSTNLALLKVVNDIMEATDRKDTTIGVFVDLRKAFDTLNHDILVNKLHHLGIRGTANLWLRSYLSNRKQFVKIGSSESDHRTVKHGVPQGGILSPLLFLIYINDIVNVSRLINFALFADDTTVTKSGNDVAQLCQEVSRELSKLQVWFNINRLSLNVTKTNFMVFGKARTVVNPHVSINGLVIQRVSHTKFLGVLLDDKLRWNEQIKHVSGKIAKASAILFKVKDVLDIMSMKLIYFAIVHSHLNYCVEVWANTYESNLQCIVVLQKRCIRTVCKVDYRAHTDQLFANLKVLKFNDIVRLMSLLVMHKAYYCQLPVQLQNRFIIGNLKYNIITRQANKFRIAYSRTTSRYQGVVVKGPKLWNSLPPGISCIDQLDRFRTRLKLFLTSGYNTASTL